MLLPVSVVLKVPVSVVVLESPAPWSLAASLSVPLSVPVVLQSVTAGDVVAAGRDGDRVAVGRAVVVRSTLVGQDIVFHLDIRRFGDAAVRAGDAVTRLGGGEGAAVRAGVRVRVLLVDVGDAAGGRVGAGGAAEMAPFFNFTRK